jgi:predicted component of type VI protein secretion system
MSLADRIISGLRTVVLIEERVSRLDSSLTTLTDTVQGKLANHETRLTRIETMIEIARPDGSTLRIASPGQTPSTGASTGPKEDS